MSEAPDDDEKTPEHIRRLLESGAAAHEKFSQESAEISSAWRSGFLFEWLKKKVASYGGGKRETTPDPIPEMPNPTPPEWWGKIVKNWALIRLGHEGMMLDKIGRQQQFVEQLATNTMTNDMSATDGLPEEDMSVSIGNEHHYHYQGSQPATPTTPTQPQQPTTPTTPTQPATPTTPPIEVPQMSFKERAFPYLVSGAVALGGLGAYHWLTNGDTTQPPGNQSGQVLEYETGFGEPEDVE